MNKIKNKLLIALVVVMLVPATLIGAYSLFSTSNVLRENVLSAHINKIDLIQERIKNLLNNVDSDVLYLRDASALQLFLSTTEESGSHTERLLLTNLRHAFQKFAEQKDIYHKVRFLDVTGQEVVSIEQDNGRAKIISDTHLRNEADRDYFSETFEMERNDFRISSLMLDRKDGQIVEPYQPTLLYSTPVFDKGNTLRGIIVLNVDATRLIDIIKAGNKEGEQLLFVDQTGFYYYTPDQDKTWGSSDNLDTGHNLFKENPELVSQLAAKKRLEYIETQNDIMVYNPISVSGKYFSLGTLFSIQSKSSLFKPLKDFLKIFAALALGSLAITFLLGAALSNSITKPLLDLKARVEALSNGDLDTPIKVDSRDEINDVANAIELLRKSMRILMKRSR